MELLTILFTFCATGLSSGQAPIWNNNYPGSGYQPGNQFTQPGQAPINYQPYVPGVPINIQQLEAQTQFQPGNIQQQPGQPPYNYQPGVNGINGINIQQLTQAGSTQPALQGNQQIPFGVQQNGIPINTVPQGNCPVNQQFIPPFGNVGTPGSINFPG